MYINHKIPCAKGTNDVAIEARMIDGRYRCQLDGAPFQFRVPFAGALIKIFTLDFSSFHS